MKSNTTLLSSSCKIKAIDMGGQVRSGAISIAFGTIYVTGLTTGTSRIQGNTTGLTDDDGSVIESAIRTGIFTMGISSPYPAALVSEGVFWAKPPRNPIHRSINRKSSHREPGVW